eukprot:gene3980-biopygen18870
MLTFHSVAVAAFLKQGGGRAQANSHRSEQSQQVQFVKAVSVSWLGLKKMHMLTAAPRGARGCPSTPPPQPACSTEWRRPRPRRRALSPPARAALPAEGTRTSLQATERRCEQGERQKRVVDAMGCGDGAAAADDDAAVAAGAGAAAVRCLHLLLLLCAASEGRLKK